MPSELWLIRHGETEWSRSGRHTGRTDIPLTEHGRAVAAALGDRLREIEFARILTSPLVRARETCELAGFAKRAEVVADLREWDYGDDEGRTTAGIRTERPGWTVWRDGPRGGETAVEIAERADRVIAGVRAKDERVAAFGHGHFSRVLAARWIAKPVADGALYRLDTAAICVLAWERETPVLKLWNDTGRLPSQK
jgi:probable phosphoglycerate mutase